MVAPTGLPPVKPSVLNRQAVVIRYKVTGPKLVRQARLALAEPTF